MESLTLELEHKGMWFTNIKPGLTDTEMADIASKELSFLKVSPEYCAKECLHAINRRKYVYYVPQFLYYPMGNLYLI